MIDSQTEVVRIVNIHILNKLLFFSSSLWLLMFFVIVILM